MFGAAKKKTYVLAHWYTLLDGFQYSTTDFYAEIEKELTARQVPHLNISRVEYHEGSVLSDKRVYLRLARERFAFDVCAAPFGRSYFFSLRLIETPRSWLGGVLIAVILIGALSVAFKGCSSNQYQGYGPPQSQSIGFGIFLWICGAIIAIYIFVRLTSTKGSDGKASTPGFVTPTGEFDVGSFLLNLPIIGDWYERFRKDTYYRHDTRLMYLTLVSEIVKKKVEEISAAKGVKLLETHEHSPILADLYKPTTVALGK